MNVVVVNESMPYPATAGNRIRTLNLMLKLAGRHRITYICRGGDDNSATQEGVDYLTRHGIRVIVAEGTLPHRHGAGLYAHALANVMSPHPYAVAAHRSPAVRAAIINAARTASVDLWQFEWLAYADALRGVAGARRLVVAHNVESLIWQRYVQNEHNPIKRLYLWSQWKKFERFERRVFQEVDGVVCVSAADEALARAAFNIGHTAVVDNGVDCEHFAAVSRDPRPATILFLGSLEWRPNLDALRVLLEQIYPLVRGAEPAVRLQIVGRNPPQWLRERCDPSLGVELLANVPDVRPHLAAASVMAVPLRIGGGSRLKILEAMAAGTPVVSTSVGCEGLAVRDRVHLRIGDAPDAQASLLLEAIREPERSLAMSRTARQLVRDQYDWESLARRLEGVWEELARYRAGPQAQRLIETSGAVRVSPRQETNVVPQA